MRLVSGVDIIGRGWRFPIKVNAKGGLDRSEGPDRVRDAIWIILSTSLGERLMRPEFGAGLQDYVFEPNSAVVRAELASSIRRALVQGEPRIELISLRVDPSPEQDSQVLVSLDYKIRDTNELFNMVYPFYLQEGTV
jgi:phage baseplate assembly protein W